MDWFDGWERMDELDEGMECWKEGESDDAYIDRPVLGAPRIPSPDFNTRTKKKNERTSSASQGNPEDALQGAGNPGAKREASSQLEPA
ncbi:hypothetical protein CCM_02124 [Cordyceps militaris CM01]|uniref:Uncharacterized protein n=1 Tax=Cordyceps militaris (strain CM01) TaxID=983644 RepID=G3J812_CORMM|nr:uncharacterized protein CCM_02124 [Cordyceps militaris CM01]EGX93854.1 hypothetical protein CCM_02124 [Cordyceps militaris CM01]